MALFILVCLLFPWCRMSKAEHVFLPAQKDENRGIAAEML